MITKKDLLNNPPHSPMNKYSKVALELCIENSNFAAFWLVENSTNSERGRLLRKSIKSSIFLSLYILIRDGSKKMASRKKTLNVPTWTSISTRFSYFETPADLGKRGMADAASSRFNKVWLK